MNLCNLQMEIRAFVNSSRRNRMMRSISSILWMYLSWFQAASLQSLTGLTTAPTVLLAIKTSCMSTNGWSGHIECVSFLLTAAIANLLRACKHTFSFRARAEIKVPQHSKGNTYTQNQASNFLYGRCISRAFMSSNCIFVFLPETRASKLPQEVLVWLINTLNKRHAFSVYASRMSSSYITLQRL